MSSVSFRIFAFLCELSLGMLLRATKTAPNAYGGKPLAEVFPATA